MGFWDPAATAADFAFLDPKTQAPLVSGVDEVQREGVVTVRKTTYRDAQNAVIGVETTRYNLETLALESYEFQDLQVGEHVAVKVVAGGRAAVSYVGERGGAARTDEIDWDEHSFTPKLLAELIQARWRDVVGGKDVKFDMYVPFLLKTLGFRLKPGKADRDGRRTVRVEPTNFMLKAFVPAIDFTFVEAAGVPRLVTYAGPAAVAIGGEKHKAVEIRF